jgi:hypothetical protein
MQSLQVAYTAGILLFEPANRASINPDTAVRQFPNGNQRK